ncbi:eukaryotic translation initiation factor 3 subunit G isoform X1 [Zalophus californianus]|uniref:Eukaryotic translation initiation factor 3 subunit G isoform X1 n=1 Tax=Zalophus californianus TaxID=9704 RepID=A0A6J2C6J7_ZALCA|nr:eukaryotic translation initiation factor 3 subunit G isoform X1 [Zalophus californianus]
MPTGDFDSKPSWADQVEEEGEDDKCVTSELLKGIPLATGDTSPEPELLPGAPLPPPKEVINGNIKTVTEYKIDEDGKKFKIVRTFRIETRKASKAVARRKSWSRCRPRRTRRGSMCRQACAMGPAAVGSPCSPTAEPMTMPLSVSPTCQRTLVRLTYRSSSGLLAPSLASTWQRTRPLASPRALPSSASTAVRMLHEPLLGCPALDTTTSSSTLSGPSHQPTKPVVTFAAAARPRPQDLMAIEGSPREPGVLGNKKAPVVTGCLVYSPALWLAGPVLPRISAVGRNSCHYGLGTRRSPSGSFPRGRSGGSGPVGGPGPGVSRARSPHSAAGLSAS